MCASGQFSAFGGFVPTMEAMAGIIRAIQDEYEEIFETTEAFIEFLDWHVDDVDIHRLASPFVEAPETPDRAWPRVEVSRERLIRQAPRREPRYRIRRRQRRPSEESELVQLTKELDLEEQKSR